MSARVTVVGAGVAGLAAALELALAGVEVEVLERATRPGGEGASRFAGGMLAPWCECVEADPVVAELGRQALDWWPARFPGTQRNGTLVVAAARDAAELDAFARRSERWQRLDADGIAGLEPDLAGRFRRGLFFPDEAHLDPRAALAALAARLGDLGVPIRCGRDGAALPADGRVVLDCRGCAARELLPELRGVRGDMLLLRSAELAFSRPIRLLHPRGMAYVVPRGDGLFMLGGSMLESDAAGPVSARSAMELLNAAYALHPAFAEAGIVELGAGLRPAFPDNLPRLLRRDGRWHLNGLYRHGFLLAPAMARRAAATLSGAG